MLLLLFALFFDDFFFACMQNFFFWSKFFEKGDKKLDLNDEYDSSFNQILRTIRVRVVVSIQQLIYSFRVVFLNAI